MSAVCGTPSESAIFSPILPGTNTSTGSFAASATSICGTRESLNASSDIGRRTPVVPITEIPPSIPSTGFKVFFASSTPAGMAIVTRAPVSVRPVISSMTLRISFRGPSLIDGSPTGRLMPRFVTVPTPSPAQNSIPVSSRSATVVNTEAPFVMSGSSPENFTTSARIPSAVSVTDFTGIVRGVPSSAVRSTVFQSAPAIKRNAALTPAAAHAPVV